MNPIFKDYKILDELKRKVQIIKNGNNIGSELFTSSYMSHLPFYKYDTDLQEEESEYEENKNHPYRYLKDTTTDEFVDVFLNENDNINIFIQFLYDVLIIEILPSINNEIYSFLNKSSNDANKDNIEYYYNSNIECVKLLFKGGTLMNVYQKYLFKYLSVEKGIDLNNTKIKDDKGNEYNISEKFKNSDTDTNIFIDSYNKSKFNFLYSIISKLLVNTLCSISYILDIFVGNETNKNDFIAVLKKKYQEQYEKLDDPLKHILSKDKFKFEKLNKLDDININLKENCLKEYIRDINKDLYKNKILVVFQKISIYNIIIFININFLKKHPIKNIELISELINVLKTCIYIINFDDIEKEYICQIIDNYVNYLECIKICRIINLDIIYHDFNTTKFDKLKEQIVAKYNDKKQNANEYFYKKENKKYYKFCDNDITKEMIFPIARDDFLLSNLNNQYYSNIEIDKKRSESYNYFNANLNKLYCKKQQGGGVNPNNLEYVHNNEFNEQIYVNMLKEQQNIDIEIDSNLQLSQYNQGSNYHYISINTSIIQNISSFKFTNDFDLYRIKLNLEGNDILKEYNDKNFLEPHIIKNALIPSEILDVSISKYNDSTRIEHSNELKQKEDGYNIYNVETKKLNLLNTTDYLLSNINIYNSSELMHDLSLVLFSQNPNTFITPWEDLKYGKRLLRLFFFLFIYENFDTNNEQCKIMKGLNDFINSIYDVFNDAGYYTSNDVQATIDKIDILKLIKTVSAKYCNITKDFKDIIVSFNKFTSHSNVGNLVFYQMIDVNNDYNEIYLLISYYIFYILFLEYLQKYNKNDNDINMVFKYIYDNKYRFFLKLYDDNNPSNKKDFLYNKLISNFFNMIKESKLYLNYFVDNICSKTDSLVILPGNTQDINQILNPLSSGGGKNKKLRLKLKNRKNKRNSNNKNSKNK